MASCFKFIRFSSTLTSFSQKYYRQWIETDDILQTCANPLLFYIETLTLPWGKRNSGYALYSTTPYMLFKKQMLFIKAFGMPSAGYLWSVVQC
jgi:hypothetical protein